MAFVAAMTLFPTPGSKPTTVPLCIVCGDRGVTDLVLNILLFAPMGAGLALLAWPARRVLLAAALLSAIVELLQLYVVVGRDPSIGDVVNNTAGSLVGAFVARRWRTWALPGPGGKLPLAVGGALAWLLVMAATAVALRPAPTPLDYFGQVRPDQPEQWDRFTGEVLAADAGRHPLPEGRMAPTQARALRDTVLLSATVLPPAVAPRRLAPIVAVFDRGQHEIATLAQRGNALMFRARTGAHPMRLSAPTVVIAGVFADHRRAGCARAGVPLELTGIMVSGRMLLAVHGGTCALAAMVPLRVSHGWTLLLPFRHAYGGPWTSPLSALWIGGLVLAWSWWAGCAAAGAPRRRAALLAMTAATLLAALGLLPALAGLPRAAWWEWASALGGAAAGWMAARWLARGGDSAPEPRPLS